jgi:pilus assembly protein CpaE
VIAAVDASTHLCMVGMLDALSLKDTKIGFQTLEQMGYDPDGVTLVLNRADSNVGISRHDVRRLLDREPDVLVPSDRAIPRAITSGKVIVDAEPKSGAARAFGLLADRFVEARRELLGQAASTDEPSRRRTLLKRGR